MSRASGAHTTRTTAGLISFVVPSVSPRSVRCGSRARAVPVYAALATLGRDGLADLVERTCRLAARMAERLSSHRSLRVLNDVVLNQVLVRVEGADADALTRDMIARVQQEGTCWAGGTTWHGMAALRISVCNWSTTAADIDQSADAILAATDVVVARSQG